MYVEAGKIIQKREATLRKEPDMKRENEIQAMKDKLFQEFLKEAAKQNAQTAEEKQRWNDEFI